VATLATDFGDVVGTDVGVLVGAATGVLVDIGTLVGGTTTAVLVDAAVGTGAAPTKVGGLTAGVLTELKSDEKSDAGTDPVGSTSMPMLSQWRSSENGKP
jgi:hypothetical protein